jgi:hypothetical protein
MSSLFILLLLSPAILALGGGKVVPCSDNKPAPVLIPIGKVTTINFPTAPKEAIPGEAGFDIKRIGEDLVIKPVKLSAHTNLVVYLENRRCFFHLVASSRGEESVFVRDPKSTTIEAKYVDQK